MKIGIVIITEVEDGYEGAAEQVRETIRVGLEALRVPEHYKVVREKPTITMVTGESLGRVMAACIDGP